MGISGVCIHTVSFSIFHLAYKSQKCFCFFKYFLSISFILEFVWIFCLQICLGILKCFCLPGIDHQHTNAKNIFVSLEFSVVDFLKIFLVIFCYLGSSVDFLSSS